MRNVYNFVGDLQQLNIVYNAALLADAEKSADKTIRAQITATKITQTALRSGGLPRSIKPGGGINNTHLPRSGGLPKPIKPGDGINNTHLPRSGGLPKPIKSGGGINSTHLPPRPKERKSVKLQTLRFFFFLFLFCCVYYYF
jgi:hypothetical protein